MQIQISAGDTFHYTTPDFILTALVGQTITYGTGKDNVQVVTNGLEDSVDIDQTRPEAFSTRFIQDVFDALQVDDPAVVDAAIDAFGLAQFPKCMHGLLIAAARQARGDALPTMPMRWNHRR